MIVVLEMAARMTCSIAPFSSVGTELAPCPQAWHQDKLLGINDAPQLEVISPRSQKSLTAWEAIVPKVGWGTLTSEDNAFTVT